MPKQTVQQEDPSHILIGRSPQVFYEANQCLQHHSQCLQQALSPVALLSRERNNSIRWIYAQGFQ